MPASGPIAELTGLMLDRCSSDSGVGYSDVKGVALSAREEAVDLWPAALQFNLHHISLPPCGILPDVSISLPFEL